MTGYAYHLDEGALTLRPGFRDNTINLFEWVFPEGVCALTVHREPRADASFAELVEASCEGLRAQLTAYREMEPMAVRTRVDAVSRRFDEWNGTRHVYHHRVFLDRGDAALVFTTSGPYAARARVDQVLHVALSGLRLR